MRRGNPEKYTSRSRSTGCSTRASRSRTPTTPPRPPTVPTRAIGTLSSCASATTAAARSGERSEEHTSELQSQSNLVCRLLLEKKNEAFALRAERGPDRISPFFVPRVIPNMASCQIAIQFGLEVPNNTDTTACAASTHALGNAYRVLQRGDADVMLAGGAEANLCRFGLASFAAMKVLSTQSEDPIKASRPFDAQRDGFVPGEGAGMLVLETLEHAQGRAAEIYGEIIGFAVTDDAFHIVMPEEDGDGPAQIGRASCR